MADFNKDAFLDSLGLTPEQRKSFEDVLGNEETGKKLKDAVLMRSDHSRAMNELTEAQKTTKAKEDAAIRREQELIQWKAEQDKALVDYQKELEAAKLAAWQGQEKIKTLAERYAIDPSELGLTQPAPVIPNNTPVNQSAFVTKDDFQKAVADVMRFPEVAAEIADIQAEHTQLYGKPLSESRKLVQEAIKTGKPVREVWETQFKVADRRTEITVEQQKQHDQQIRDEERTKVLSEVKIPVPRAGATPAPVFTINPTPKPLNQRLDPVAAAVEAYNQRTYDPTVAKQ